MSFYISFSRTWANLPVNYSSHITGWTKVSYAIAVSMNSD